MKILFLAPINFNSKIKRKLKKKYNINFHYGINKDKLKKIISSYDILITNPDHHIDMIVKFLVLQRN